MNDKQQRFVDEYLIDLNATQAAIRAGYSAKTAAQQAFKLLRNTQIQQALDAAKEERAAKVEITQEWVVNRLVENHDRAALDGNGNVANRALELLGKHVGMFGDRLEVTGKDRGPIQLASRGVSLAALIAWNANAGVSSDLGLPEPRRALSPAVEVLPEPVDGELAPGELPAPRRA